MKNISWEKLSNDEQIFLAGLNELCGSCCEASDGLKAKGIYDGYSGLTDLGSQVLVDAEIRGFIKKSHNFRFTRVVQCELNRMESVVR